MADAGLWLVRQQFMAMGLLLIAAHPALGFDGLGHYAVASLALHTFGANLTILSELAIAALLLPVSLFLLARQWVRARG